MQKLIPISDLIKKSWDLYLGNFQKFLKLLIIMIIPYFFYYLALFYKLFYKGPQAFTLFALISALMAIINLWLGIIFIILIDKLYKKQPVEINNKLYEIAFKKLASYFWVVLLTALVVLGGFILLIIPGIIFIVWYSFAPYINVLEKENNKGKAALTASKTLVKGRWGATFWRLVLPPLFVYFIMMIIVSGLTFIISRGNISSELLQQNILSNVIFALITIILTPLFASFPIILYNNLKETKKETIEEPTEEPTVQI